MKIAMLLDPFGRATNPEADGTIYVYERRGNEWVVSRTRTHAASGYDTVVDMRAYLTETCEWLGEETVFAARAPRGFGRLVFAQHHVDYWVIDGEGNNDLDQIEAAYAAAHPRLVSAG